MRFTKDQFVLRLFLVLWFSGSVATVVSPQTQISVSSSPASAALPADRTVSLKQLPGNILEDQKGVWLFPVKLVHGEHWWPTIGVLGVTAGLVASDAHTAPTFGTTNDFSGYNRVFSGANTAAFIAAVPAVIYGVGWLRKDSYAQGSALLAGRSSRGRVSTGYSPEGYYSKKAATPVHGEWSLY